VTVEQRGVVSPQEVAVIDVLRRHADVRGEDANDRVLDGWLAADLVLAYVKGTCPKTRTRTVRRVLDRLVDGGLVEAALVGDHLSFRWHPRWAL
jgi:Fe2+ or Zn2+ uptake regulation protein